MLRKTAGLLALLVCTGPLALPNGVGQESRPSDRAQTQPVRQQLDQEQLAQALRRDGAVSLAGAKLSISTYDYLVDGRNLEAILFRPDGEGPFPVVLLIPGYSRTAYDYIRQGVLLAREGYASIAVTQPGFGKSDGPADYVGPKTLKALGAGLDRLKAEPFADRERVGIYGYSRGAMAASLLAVTREDLDAVVLGAGVYDFRKAHDEVTIEGIRQNMEQESGWTEEAIADRTSITRMRELKCPVLILHGELDENVPVNQATMLRDELTRLGKAFEVHLFPDHAHSLGPEVMPLTVDFFDRHLKPTR